MKTNFFLAAVLLVTAFGYSQTYSAPDTGNGSNNTFIGAGSGEPDGTTVGDFNSFLGYRSGRYSQGNSNTFVGYFAGSYHIDSTGVYGNNSCLGHYSGQNLAGTSNTCLGFRSGDKASGSYNFFGGGYAGETSNGDYNVYAGYFAGRGIKGTKNVFLGYNVGNFGAGIEVSNSLYIDNSSTSNPLIYGEFDNNILKFNAERVGIGFDNNDEFGDFPDNTLVNYDDYRLFVRGGILAEEIRIRSYVNWADYVFAEDYKLMPLTEVEMYIADNGHLPNMPSAEEVEKEGLELGNIVKLQQEKIEELTLHLIEQEKEIERLRTQNKRIEHLEARNVEIDELKAQVQLLLNKQ